MKISEESRRELFASLVSTLIEWLKRENLGGSDPGWNFYTALENAVSSEVEKVNRTYEIRGRYDHPNR